MQSLEAFYQSELMPDLIKLDAQRKTVKIKLIPVAVVLGVFNLACFYVIAKWHIHIKAMTIPLVLSLLPLLAWYAKYFKGFKDGFKETIISKIVAFVHPDLIYDKGGVVPECEFAASHLFAESADRYQGDDLVRGLIGDTAIQCSEIWVQKIETIRDHSKPAGASHRTRKKSYPVFNGLFFVADFNKTFNGVTVVLPDKAQKLLGDMGQALQALNVHNGELIKLEDPEFEKMFVVYGQDQVEARYILSTSLMQRITAFQKKHQRPMRLSFAGNKLYVAIPFDRELFEPSLMDTLLDFSQVQAYYDDVRLVIDIVEALNLNRRIWGKSQ